MELIPIICSQRAGGKQREEESRRKRKLEREGTDGRETVKPFTIETLLTFTLFY